MIKNNIIIDENNNNVFQILITGISWNKKIINNFILNKKEEVLPEQFSLELPDNVLKQANLNKNNFYNVIESFVYNFLTKKFRHEVYHCQIWLPF